MKEIKATAPTPGDYMKLARENEMLIEIARVAFYRPRMSGEREKAYNDLIEIIKSKVND